MSRWAEHDLGARRAPARRMTGFIFGTAIRFRLHDFANRGAVCMLSHQILPQQLSGDINGGLLVERTEHLHGLREDFLKPLGQLFAEFVSLTPGYFVVFHW